MLLRLTLLRLLLLMSSRMFLRSGFLFLFLILSRLFLLLLLRVCARTGEQDKQGRADCDFHRFSPKKSAALVTGSVPEPRGEPAQQAGRLLLRCARYRKSTQNAAAG